MPAEPPRFQVLGPVRVWRGGRELDLGFPQQRALLALLLLHTGRTVPTGEILDTLWAKRPPASAPNVVRRYVATLRRLLEPGLPPRAPGRRLLRRTGGYLLEAETDEVDLLRFRELTRQGRRAAATGRAETAAHRFTRALGEWRGPLAMGIPESVRTHVQFTAVHRELLDTARLAADAALLSGYADPVLPALRAAAAQEPLDEPLHARLVLALAACGLQAEALRAYDDIRRRLGTDLALTPGPELTAAHTRVLRQEVRRSGAPSEAGRPARVPSAGEAWASSGAGLFVGRKDESERLSELARGSGVVLVGGMPGVGKSALAAHWAHRAAARYPDGPLYVNLRGSAQGRPALEPGDALRELLTALGVPDRRVPDGPAARAGLYRTLLAERRALVVLDDALGTEQLRPLLPAAAGCLTLVTSRNALPGLVAAGARPLRLEPPSAEDAQAILARRIGPGRIAAEPTAADEILTHCGRLPLALTVVAARLAGHPCLPLTTVAAELRAAHGGLDALSALRPALLASHHRLPDDSAHLFRALSRHPGLLITAATAAALTGLPVRRTRLLLGRLAESHLLAEPAPGHYTLHALLRALATELTGTGERPAPN
ncbi:BTAD domain-containing putative transcriptional regulator [Streptomyces sp. NPDC005820]|uniref:AfsR/SARP family transcriptional regulator n=1 Tax=Streptomyces sp. NPDC005820 TaxID=3157069 RepID=UPI0033C0BE5B